MVEENLVKNEFLKFVNAEISVDYTEEKCEYVIATDMNFTVTIVENTDINMYDVVVKLKTGHTYDLSSYDIFKDYIKRHTKKFFGKKKMDLHMKAISEFINAYKDEMSDEDTFDVLLQGHTRGMKDIFIS